MQRRHMLTLAAAAALAPGVRAQVSDLSDAINKAGRQRMLSQRMGKAWLALLQDVETGNARLVLDKSIALFDRQLVELKAYAPTAQLQGTYEQLEPVWSQYKAVLVGSVPAKPAAPELLKLDARVLALAHQGTVQYEAALGKPVGKLVNVAGRQRMLSQRMAKFYLAATVPVDAAAALVEIGKARTEFVAAMELLRTAPQATQRIRDELQVADGQWMFFDMALQKLQDGAPQGRAKSDMFVASENLLSVMDRVTGLYSALKSA
ncbi:MAG: hypothetical protein E6Q78_00705 [Rhodoferax sp.]|nr:MAG: hypothetical protein E6Q78_00705 [Rhodoferax sp.]